MQTVFGSRSTPVAAFFEGMARVFDWELLLRKLRRKPPPALESAQDTEEWSEQIVDRYVRGAIATFEAEEGERLAKETTVMYRSGGVANIVLGPMPTEEVIVQYEIITPGAADKIMEMARSRLRHDSEAEVQLFKERAKQGYWGMIAGFLMSLAISGAAMYLVFFGNSWAGLSLVGVNLSLVAFVSIYASLDARRHKWYTGEFFGRRKRSRI